MSDLVALRESYADELRATARLRSEALVRAFATVPREDFLSPGPWQIMTLGDAGSFAYRTTEDADPRHLYHDVVVAIDAARCLNNGLPSSLAGWLEQLDLQEHGRVVHVGCGTGYYTAILAELVGSQGDVTAYEIDAGLAGRARSNLTRWPNAEVIAGDGGSHTGTADAIFVNAGATHPKVSWLESLRPKGRLLVPITGHSGASAIGIGGMLKVTRQREGLAAEFLSAVGIFPCLGNRDPKLNEVLRSAFECDTWKLVRSVRLDSHDPATTCWLHGEHVCVSAQPLP